MTPTSHVGAQSAAMFSATLPAPPGRSSIWSTRITGTGASGEMRSLAPCQYRSSMTSPTTRTGAPSKRGMVSFIALLICCVFLPVGRVLLELHAVQSGVISVEGHQLGMAAALDDTPLVHHHDDVRLFDGGQAVGNHQRRTPLHHPVQGSLDMALGLGIQGRGRLVEDQDGRIAQKRAGDGQPLTLAA